MKIAQVAPLYESVPPKFYGGTERVVSFLTEELVSLGHEVTLFASGDSTTNARLISPCPESLRLKKGCVDQLAHHYVMLDDVLDHAQEFDIIHFHVDYLHFPISKLSHFQQVTTLHGRLDLPDIVPVYRKYGEMPVISISYSQRKPLYWANWVGNVYHGVADENQLHERTGTYLAFLGRISPEKRADRAIQIALDAGIPLKIAAKVDNADRVYFENNIKPLLANPNIEFIGEIAQHEKAEFLGNAYAHLFPIDWPEPFGLTMIEAMACGTPTIAFNCGSVSEVLTEGLTGTIVNNVHEAVEALPYLMRFNRVACRKEFERRFTASRMARDYVKIYEATLNGSFEFTDAKELDSLVHRAVAI